jgi:phosphoribosylaminoimidazole-succinocarboxamide synthase
VLRDYLETLDWEKKPPPPPLPPEIIEKTAETYQYIKEVLLGE